MHTIQQQLLVLHENHNFAAHFIRKTKGQNMAKCFIYYQPYVIIKLRFVNNQLSCVFEAINWSIQISIRKNQTYKY